MKILFLTYDGLTDPLGQSQVLTYLTGLSKRGYSITIVSSEKKSVAHSVSEIKQLLEKHQITWHSIQYTKYPQVLSTLYDCFKLLLLCRKICRLEKFDIVHCRSYIPALIGIRLKRRFGLKFIFDMRGFFADERIDGRIWKQNLLLNRILYKYFKRREERFLENADYTICLTERARKEIHSWRIIKGQPIPIRVIPCCADVHQFDPHRFSEDEKKAIRAKTGIQDSDFLVMYSGAIGTWYMLDEMFDFFKRLLMKKKAKFLFITYDEPENILRVARSKKIDEGLIRIVRAKHSEVPSLLSICDLSVFFIKPLYSKIASSPAKQGEIMSMGIPIICNSNIGDSDSIIKEAEGGLIIRSFSDADYDYVVGNLSELLTKSKEKIRNTALHYFSLERGIQNYHEIYQELGKQN